MGQVTSAFVTVGVVMMVGGAFFVVTTRLRSRSMKRLNTTATTTRAQVLELRRLEMRKLCRGDRLLVRPPGPVHAAGRASLRGRDDDRHPPPARVGDVVLVRFDPDQPRRSTSPAVWRTARCLGCLHTGIGTGLIGLGAVLCLIGYGISKLP